MIPAGWQELALKEVFKLASGDSRPNDVRKEASKEHCFPVYGGNGVLGYSQTHNSTDRDIIIGRVGELCGITRLVDGKKWITDNALYAKFVVPNVNRSFLTLRLQHFDLSKLRSKGGQPLVSQEPIYSQKFTFPPLPEQRRIAAVLDAWDDAIASCEKLVAAKEQRLDWIRGEVLTGQVRLPGFDKVWRIGPLARVLTEHGQTSTGTEEVHSVSVHQGLINQIEHLGRSFAAASTVHYNRVLPGDIVYTKSPTGDFPLGIIKQSKLTMPVIVSPLYGVFTPASRELGALLDALFASPAAAERYLAPVVQKGAKNTIAVTNKNFLQGKLALPTDQAEIVALCALVEAARAELDTHRSELKLLRHQKRGLMQKLLTGQWLVPESVDALLLESFGVMA